MKFFRKIQTILAIAAAALMAGQAVSQTYPINTPTYIPTAILGAQTFTAAGSATFNTNGNGTLLLRVAGTNTGLSATVQITESRASGATFTAVGVQTVGGPRVATITANGLYRLSVAGAAQVKVVLASITGTNVITTMSAGPGDEQVATLPLTRQTYSSTMTVTPASSFTDFMTLTGSASATIRLASVECSGVSTAASQSLIALVKRSAADAGGTTSAGTAAALDSANVAARGAVQAFSANATTLGASVGTLRNAYLGMAAAASAIAAAPLRWVFGTQPGEQQVVLRGIAQQVALNGNAVSVASGGVVTCGFTWTEE